MSSGEDIDIPEEQVEVMGEEQVQIMGETPSSFKMAEFLDNIASAATFYCAKGFDAFDEVLLTSLALDKDRIHEVLKASIRTYAKVLEQMQQQLAVFQGYALASTTRIPRPILQPPADVQGEKVDRAQEEQCDQQISDLAQKIMQVRIATRKTHTEAAILRQEMAVHGNSGSLAGVVRPIIIGKENLADDAEAILSQAKRLGPLLNQAEQVMSHYQDTKSGISSQSASLLAEKEFCSRKAAAKGLPVEQLRMLRERLLTN